MRKFRAAVVAFLLGAKDGWDSPSDLGSGLTWDHSSQDYLNECYDRGVNLGQLVRSPLNHQRM